MGLSKMQTLRAVQEGKRFFFTRFLPSPDKATLNIPSNLAAQVKKKAMRFLRCATLFFHFYTDIPLPRKHL